MKKLQVSLFFLACFIWQTSYSQLLYPQDPKKDEYVPHYDPNVVIISDDVRKWMDEQLTQPAEKKNIEIKTDVKGRVKSSSEDIGRKKLNVVDNKQKRLVRISDMHIPQIEIEPMQGHSKYNPETKDYDYYLNDKKVTIKEYENVMEKYWEKFDSQRKDKRNLSIPNVINSDNHGWTALMTAEEISILTKKYKELAIGDYSGDESTANIASIISTIQLSVGHNLNYDGDGVGIYVMEPGCRNMSVPILNLNKYTNLCTGTVDIHHSAVVNVVQNAAPSAHIFGFRSSSPYPNPDTYFPPIEIGTHSYCKTFITDNKYSQYDMEMDKYIYDNRITNFVAAGNNGTCGTTYDVSSPGKALNAITVGAVEPATNNYANYSRWKNSDVGNEKPEIAMYTDIDMGIYNPYAFAFNGTSAATPLAAGFTAALMEQAPFYKRQPALLKAAFLSGVAIPIQNAISWDLDNSYNGTARKITPYPNLAWNARFRWNSGPNSAFFDSNNEIRFTENNIQANKRYVIAIAWLNESSYTLQNRSISQDFDLHIYQNGKRIAFSMSAANPFEVVDFIAPSNAPLDVVIHRYRNNGGDVVTGFFMQENF